MSDDNYKNPKWEIPEMSKWDTDFEEEEFDDRITNVGCRPSWSPCQPTSAPCWPHHCFPRQCYPRQCRPRFCWPRQCQPRMCMPIAHRLCNPL
ncbi:hypothetical protein SOV_13980 [Sporomusa ovata DSM 2662]|uniref:hypothetical protein n=1 Tax=Sporomusa ovata TaxID=2378 RepID=UPI0003887F80|nr:hypothetical protein [Sporomusa ovata]EQB29005.1 hypothetical protein SOV_1c07350 [Sporomusa ovata DSM 2662]